MNFYSLDDSIFHCCTLHLCDKLFWQTSQFQVISGQDSFPLNMSSFQGSLLLRVSINCLLANGWWNACFYHYIFFTKKISYLFLEVLSFLQDISLLLNKQFCLSFSYACRWLLLILPVWSPFWYLWISPSCILMQIASIKYLQRVPFDVSLYIEWNSLQIFNHIYTGI